MSGLDQIFWRPNFQEQIQGINPGGGAAQFSVYLRRSAQSANASVLEDGLWKRFGEELDFLLRTVDGIEDAVRRARKTVKFSAVPTMRQSEAVDVCTLCGAAWGAFHKSTAVITTTRVINEISIEALVVFLVLMWKP